MKRAGTLKVSKNTSAAFSRFLLGLRGASVNSTGCCREGERYTIGLYTNTRTRTDMQNVRVFYVKEMEEREERAEDEWEVKGT